MTSVVILAGSLWDGISETVHGPQDILIEKGIITRIERNIEIPDGAEVIDLRNRIVMPGLIDCHVHITLRPEMIPGFWSYSTGYKAILGAEALKIHLMNGFTTVRDCGDMDPHGFTIRDIKMAMNRGVIHGSRLIISGHMITARNGHADVHTLLSPECNPWQICLADGPDEIRRLVRKEIRWGAEWIKFAASGGFSTPIDDPVDVAYTQEEMDCLVATARQFRKPVAAHLHGDDAVRMAVQAGVRSVEHGMMASPETIRLLEEKGVFLVPTQYGGVRSARLADSEEYWQSMGSNQYMKMKIRMMKQKIVLIVIRKIKNQQKKY